MATISKTQGTVALALTAITHPDTVKGTTQSVTTALACTFFLFHSSVEAVANTNAGSFYVQASGAGSSDEFWITLAQFTASATTADTEALTATEPAAETVLAVASTTGFVATDRLYIKNTTLASSEFAMCQEIVANTSVNLIDGLTNEQTAAASTLWNDADFFMAQLDLTAIGRVRVIFVHEGATGANVDVTGLLVVGDSIA